MRIGSLAVVVVAYLWTSPAAEAATDVVLSVVSTAPTRPHFVAAGTSTTFVLAASNSSAHPVTTTVAVEGVSGSFGDWRAVVSEADALFRPVGVPSERLTVTIPAGQTVRLVTQVTAGAALAEDADGSAMVSAGAPGTQRSTVELKARVRNRPKVYYVAIDACGRGYLSLNRRGQPFDGTGERLMPRAWAFATRSARMAGASSVLPAVTDPNHAAALTGSWSGTLGIFSVRSHYLGRDAHGRAVTKNGSRDLMRWGPDGTRVPSMFDVGKTPAAGGDADTFNVMVSGKNWLAELFRDDAVDLVAHGSDHPYYVPPPQPYRLGDPSSDPDAEQDRDGTSLGPWAIKHLFSTEARLLGATPRLFPEDQWIADAAVRVIQAEDPDVLYVDLADVDAAQHLFGAADRPEEWSDRSTPNVLWDDEHAYNRYANRDPVLDVVYEADRNFGVVEDVLSARQVRDRSYVVLLSDHGMNTVMNTADTVLDPGRILLDGGMAESDVDWIANRGESGFVVLANPAAAGRAEAILESYEVLDPVQGAMVKPFVVINREEMDSGTDLAGRSFVADGVAGNRHGELYSEWNLGAPAPDNSKVKWPDLFYFTRSRFHTVNTENRLDAAGWIGLPFNGDHGSLESGDVILVASGPGIRPGVYAAPASLVDIAPTLYHLLGVAVPGSVNGRVLDEILYR